MKEWKGIHGHDVYDDRLDTLEKSNMITLDKTIEMIIGTSHRFNVKDVPCYLQAYDEEILMMDILGLRRLSCFARVISVTDMTINYLVVCLYRSILYMWIKCEC